MPDPLGRPPGSEMAKTVLNVLGYACILVDTTRRLRMIFADPILSEFIDFVGGNELAADLDSLDRITRSLREDVDRYLGRR